MNRRTTGAAALLAAQVAVLALLFHARPPGLLWWYGVAWALFAAAVWALRGVPGPAAGRLIMAGSLAVIATGLLGPPATSTDSYRYAWDGRVQSAGISPYDHAPADSALASLRDPWLFPACSSGRFYPLPDGSGCTRINRSDVHTIYPPLAEAYFLVVERLSPDGARHKPFQAGGALLAAAISAALLILLRRRGDVRLAAYWAWCPAVPMEAVNNAHVDVLAVAAVVLALATTRGRGTLLGAAVAIKLMPLIAMPGALSGTLPSPATRIPAGGAPGARIRAGGAPGTRIRAGGAARTRIPVGSATRTRVPVGGATGAPAVGRAFARVLRTLVPAVVVVVGAYLPYVVASRASVLGYLSGYVAEEGYDTAGVGGRYALLRLLLPASWALPAVLVVLGALLFHVLRHGDPARPWRGALVLTGSALLLLTPGYSWYALLVVGLVALDGRWEWLGVPVAGAAAYLGADATTAYALAAAAVAAGLWARYCPPRGRRPPRNTEGEPPFEGVGGERPFEGVGGERPFEGVGRQGLLEGS